MKRNEHVTHRKRHAPTVVDLSKRGGRGRRRSWFLWATLLGFLGLAGYLATWSAGDWQTATAPFRAWFREAPPPEEDPDDPATPPLNPATPPGTAPEGMAWIPGGWFWRGSEEFPDSHPIRKLYVDGFWMYRTEVTNKQWREFIEDTGYKTYAERQPSLKDFPKLQPQALGFQHKYVAVLASSPQLGFPQAISWPGIYHAWPELEPFSLVFKPPPSPVHDRSDHTIWWEAAPGACWKQPQGRGSSIANKDNHPVVHICWHDAVAYCEWKKKKTGKNYRLPTEAEWEFAARGGLDRKLFCWGDDQTVNGKWMCNVWQGDFPNKNDNLDGFLGTAPVASFPANGYGLHDMAGNVWEWCSDWYQPDYYEKAPKQNPRGPDWSFDPHEVTAPKRVQRGGSFLCCDNYCVRYLPGARGKGEPTSAAEHIGFRCVMDAK
jgi:formylglycine-generating enzyme required for sulfatase activity